MSISNGEYEQALDRVESREKAIKEMLEYIKRLRDALRETLDYAVNCWDNDPCNQRKHIPEGKITFACEFELLNEEIDQISPPTQHT